MPQPLCRAIPFRFRTWTLAAGAERNRRRSGGTWTGLRRRCQRRMEDVVDQLRQLVQTRSHERTCGWRLDNRSELAAAAPMRPTSGTAPLASTGLTARSRASKANVRGPHSRLNAGYIVNRGRIAIQSDSNGKVLHCDMCWRRGDRNQNDDAPRHRGMITCEATTPERRTMRERSVQGDGVLHLVVSTASSSSKGSSRPRPPGDAQKEVRHFMSNYFFVTARAMQQAVFSSTARRMCAADGVVGSAHQPACESHACLDHQLIHDGGSMLPCTGNERPDARPTATDIDMSAAASVPKRGRQDAATDVGRRYGAWRQLQQI